MVRIRSVLVLVVLAIPYAWAEPAAPPAFTNLRYDEDWSQYEPDDGGTWFAPIKHLTLSENVWLSLGGDARVRWEYWNGVNFDNDFEDNFLLYRTFVHADLHLGEHVRLFTQGRFSDIESRDLPGGNREALDYDQGDLWNTFLEVSVPAGELKLTARGGRMELQYGKQRLISPLDWSNNRRIFDGGLLQLAGPEGRWKLDAFVTKPVTIDGGAFTWNDTDANRTFAGLYYTHQLGTARKHALEGYLLYQQRDAVALVREDLYTLGARASGPIVNGLTYDLEAAGQFGTREVSGTYFDDTLDIGAWFASAELKYTLGKVWGKPYVLLGLDYASGDDDPTDDQVGTFNQLFPLGHAYFGYIDTVARQNVMALHAGAGMALVPDKFTVALDWHLFRRAEETDNLYNAGGAPARSPVYVTPGNRTVTARDNEIGHELDVTLQYTVNRHFAITGGYSHFFTGGFLEESGASDDMDFVYTQVEFTF
jgi:hypothetical protein